MSATCAQQVSGEDTVSTFQGRGWGRVRARKQGSEPSCPHPGCPPPTVLSSHLDFAVLLATRPAPPCSIFQTGRWDCHHVCDTRDPTLFPAEKAAFFLPHPRPLGSLVPVLRVLPFIQLGRGFSLRSLGRGRSRTLAEHTYLRVAKCERLLPCHVGEVTPVL